MLGTLSAQAPRDSHSLWDQFSRTYASPPNSSATLNPIHALPTASQSHQQPHNQRGRRRSGQHGRHTHGGDLNRMAAQPPTALQALRADEELFSRRKDNIRKFGAGWLRPPGLPKTLQASLDEAAERLEQEALARREEGAREMREAQERIEREQRLQQMAQEAEQGDVGIGMDHDLDEEVPDAADTSWGHNEDEDDLDDAEGLMEAEDEERDLDDDVPEAGSYQHTDTELEDDTTLDDTNGFPSTRNMTVVQEMAFGPERSDRFTQTWLNGAEDGQRGNIRSSFDGAFTGSVLQGESSLLMSSPTVARNRDSDSSRNGPRRRS